MALDALTFQQKAYGSGGLTGKSSQQITELRHEKPLITGIQAEPPAKTRESDAGSDARGSNQSNTPGWLGSLSLICACLAWVDCYATCLAETGRMPKAFTHTAVNLLILVACVLTANFGGAISVVNQRSTAGLLALVLGVLHVLTTMTCIGMAAAGVFGSGWLD